MSDKKYETTDYSDNEIIEYVGTPIPTFLKWTYFILPIWGIFMFYFYWNGSEGWLDRGHWKELQQVANTRFEEKTNP